MKEKMTPYRIIVHTDNGMYEHEVGVCGCKSFHIAQDTNTHIFTAILVYYEDKMYEYVGLPYTLIHKMKP